MTNTVLSTITITDKNTLRPITWNVDHVMSAGENVARLYGWTHAIAISRPKGRRSFLIHAELIGDVIVRHTDPVKVF